MKIDVQDARRKFNAHRAGAAARGIEFLFTFDEWLLVWAKSGKWKDRGRRKGQYCMARKKDMGPYSTSNVEIKTCTANQNERRLPEPEIRAAKEAVDYLTSERLKLGEIATMTAIPISMLSRLHRAGMSMGRQPYARLMQVYDDLKEIKRKHPKTYLWDTKYVQSRMTAAKVKS